MRSFLRNIIFLLIISQQFQAQISLYHFKKLRSVQGFIKKGQKEGKWLYWSPLAYPVKSETYLHGKLQGASVFYKNDAADMDQNAIIEMAGNNALYELRLKRQKYFEKFPADWEKLLIAGFFQVEKIIYYKEGKKDSVYTYLNGKVSEIVFFPVEDTSIYAIRTCRAWSPRDSFNQKIEEITYKNGIRNGAFRSYNTKFPKEVLRGFYLDGKKDSIWTNEFSESKVIYRYRKGDYNGLHERYKDGLLTDSVLYVNGQREGLCKLLRIEKKYTKKTSDTLLEYMNYRQGKLDGNSVKFKNGKRVGLSSYKNGIKDGEWSTYYENGALKNQSYYKNGEKDGTWGSWNEQGLLLWKTVYGEGAVMEEIENYGDGKLRRSMKKEGKKKIESWFYPDGKKKQLNEITPEKEIYTSWDETGKKSVKIVDKRNIVVDPIPRMEKIQELPEIKTGTRDAEDVQEEKTEIKSKYDKLYEKLESKYKEKGKKTDFSKVSFPGGEDALKDYLNLMTGCDKRDESEKVFYLQTAITVSARGEITFIGVTNTRKNKIDKKYFKEAERITLMMPKWNPTRNAGLATESNTGFNIWFDSGKK